MDTVAEPTEILTTAATRNATSTIGRGRLPTKLPNNSPIPEFCRINLSIPPPAISRMILPQECREFVIMFVISLMLKPPGSPKNSMAQIVDSKSAMTGVPRNSRTGCAGFMNGITEDNVFRMIKNSGSRMIHTISQKFGFLPVFFCSASFSFSR